MKSTDLFLPAGSPESVGIPSEAVMAFLDEIDANQTCMHGFLLLRHGKIAAEGYWAPYTRDRLHRMYSVSKSFVALAVGLMVDEGKIALDDKAATYFPDKVPGGMHRYLEETTLWDLLVMATPYSRLSYGRYDKDWAATFFNKEPDHPSGTIFCYDTAATVILNTIVERISGKSFLDYMRPKLLDPIGFSKDAFCIQTPEGTSWGGSGVLCTLRDMAKLAYVCMNRGKWGDRQLISEDYIAAATSKQIDNALSGYEGYGYQIWRAKNNGFAFRGMGSQLAFCYPHKDFLFACLSDTQGAGATGTGIQEGFDRLFDNISMSPLPENPKAWQALNEKIHSLKILPQRGKTTSPIGKTVHGVWYHMNENPMGIKRTRFLFNGNEGIWEYENATGMKRLPFGIGKKIAGPFPQEGYYGYRIGEPWEKRYDCLASGAWVEDHKFNMLVYITDIYLGTMKATFAFKGREIAVYMTKAAEWFLDEYQGFAGGIAIE